MRCLKAAQNDGLHNDEQQIHKECITAECQRVTEYQDIRYTGNRRRAETAGDYDADAQCHEEKTGKKQTIALQKVHFIYSLSY